MRRKHTQTHITPLHYLETEFSIFETQFKDKMYTVFFHLLTFFHVNIEFLILGVYDS